MNTVTWLFSLAMTLTSISCASCSIYWSRWSSSAAVEASVAPPRSNWPLMVAIWAIALLATRTLSAMPASALERCVWMPCEATLSCWASMAAALTAVMRADAESGLVESPCKALVKPLKAASMVPVEPGLP